MLKIIGQRLLFSVITLTIVAVVVFVMTDLLPGDWAQAYFGRDATPESLAAMRARYGLDRPATERFAEWFSGALRGDFGTSLARDKPVVEVIALRLRNSLVMGGLAVLVAIPVATVLGIIAGLTRDRAQDVTISTISLIGMSTPEFVIGTVLIWIFGVMLKLFPAVHTDKPGRADRGFTAQHRFASRYPGDCLDSLSPAHGSDDHDQCADQRVCRNGHFEGPFAFTSCIPSRVA